MAEEDYKSRWFIGAAVGAMFLTVLTGGVVAKLVTDARMSGLEADIKANQQAIETMESSVDDIQEAVATLKKADPEKVFNLIVTEVLPRMPEELLREVPDITPSDKAQ